MGISSRSDEELLMILQSLDLSDFFGLPFFFLAGLYVALSPCLFPIMPLTIFRIMNTDMKDSEGKTIDPSRKLVLRWVSMLVLGILTTFAGVTFIGLYVWSGLGIELISLYRPLSLLMGAILVTMGIFIIFPQLSEMTFARIPIPQGVSNMMVREEYKQVDLFVMGLGYSVIAFPCASPVFISMFGILVSVGNLLYMAVGMGVFGIGLFVPYLILVFVTAESRTRIASKFTENFRKIEVFMGLLIALFGIIFLLVGFSILTSFPIFLPF
ncbi:MAG: cytochrome c biogenesis protein CcdA [Candidatus Hodarchaeales archaeon]